MCFEIKCVSNHLQETATGQKPQSNHDLLLHCEGMVPSSFSFYVIPNQIWQKHNALSAKPVSFSEFFICKIKGKCIFI